MTIRLAELYQLTRRLRSLVSLEFSAGSAESAIPAYVPVVLTEVMRTPGCAMQDLVTGTRMAQSVVSKAVHLARKKGWLQIKPDPNDARRLLVYPARNLMSAVKLAESRDAKEVLRPLLHRLNAAEQSAVMRGLELLVKANSAEESI